MKKKALLILPIPTESLLEKAVNLGYQFNLAILRAFPELGKFDPTKHCRYKQESRETPYEHIRTIDVVLDEGFGDCEDIANAYAAYSTFNGIPCEPRIIGIEFTDGSKIKHVICVFADGTEFDPSIACGMPVSKGIRRL